MVFTLIGKLLAVEGLEFVYFSSDPEECEDCNLRDACHNLEDRWHYKIVGVRDVEHDCGLHEGGVKGVDVEPVPVEIAVEGRGVEGSILSCKLRCDADGCGNFIYCATAEGKKVKILKDLGKLECPKGKTLRHVMVELIK